MSTTLRDPDFDPWSDETMQEAKKSKRRKPQAEKSRETERITINGMKFRADRLAPNYRGEYDDICGNCIFDKDWVDFGRGADPCRRVECMRTDRTAGNRNVWIVDGDQSQLKQKPATWWVSFSWTYRWYDPWSKTWSDESDCHACRFRCREENIERHARRYVLGELDGEEYRDLRITINDHYITTDYEV